MKKYSINKARLMSRAWQIAKTLTGDIAARLSLALRTAWQETKTASGVRRYPDLPEQGCR